ncbi:MAG: hypothetical protein JST00_33935 [Deltaproteobacteria bacterium]|nr:hypothetical protein [Deltaproteobacteria bacterium]
MTNVPFARSARVVLLLTLTVAVPRAAVADTGGQDKALAEALFDQGVAAMKQGQNAEACPKLAESQRLDPAPGTLLYLADCYEKVGKLATAWATFREAAASAHAGNQPAREELGNRRAALLAKELPYVTVAAPSAASGTEIRLDDTPLRTALWGTEVPVDPGSHAIHASGAGLVPWSTTINVGRGEHVRVDVPVLAREAGGQAPAAVSPPSEPTTSPPPEVHEPGRRSWQRPAGLVIGAVGLVAIGVGSVFGARAFSKWGDAEPLCPNDLCTPEGRELADSASSAAGLSTGMFVAGAVLATTGAVLFFTAPKSASSMRARAGVAGITFEGRF